MTGVPTHQRNEIIKLIQRRCDPDRVNLQQIESLLEFGAITYIGDKAEIDDVTLFIVDPGLHAVLREMNQRSREQSLEEDLSDADRLMGVERAEDR
jgi:hypothetical protein